MMKRYFLPIALLIFLLLSLSACGESHSPNRSLSFELLDNGTYAVVGIGTYNADDLIIPAEYNNAPVTQIASNAFRDVWYIQSVTLPPSALLHSFSISSKILFGSFCSSWMVYAFDGWKGKAIMLSMQSRSTVTIES